MTPHGHHHNPSEVREHDLASSTTSTPGSANDRGSDSSAEVAEGEIPAETAGRSPVTATTDRTC